MEIQDKKPEISRPILFQTEMVQAILKGRKVMTRRLITKHDYLNDYQNVKIIRDADVANEDGEEKTLKGLCAEFDGGEWIVKCKYDIGDTLWVRETWCTGFSDGELFHYKASDPNPDEFKRMGWTWRPSIFMPRAASRITLKITNIKVERVQDISEEDAIKEGVDLSKVSGDWEHTPVQEFESLWIKINGQESWDSNPFCWCVEFEKI